ncbi:hypothetical protein [Paenibacillus eucommiae]|uniref:Lipoprotein n=1 Tax=Paenibacillus eucommiae TaxID=1355755 RepID=A0ABS4J5W1_9BACL|nr:hypothetical protein [Paenibacillus eucommiae]MBP1995210.1 hypothetical protein [Paenibacillus eucommiae]
MSRRLFIFTLFLSLLITLSACGTNKSDILKELTSNENGKLSMPLFSSSADYEYQVLEVINSEPKLLEQVEKSQIYRTKDEHKWLKRLGVESKYPDNLVLIFDDKELLFQTHNPEELREFAKKLK